MRPSFANQTVQLVTPAMVSDHGTLAPDWDAVTLTDVKWCSIQPGAGGVNGERRTAVESDLSVWVFSVLPDFNPAFTHVRVPGYPTDFVIGGFPERWPLIEHTVLHLNAWEG